MESRLLKASRILSNAQVCRHLLANRHPVTIVDASDDTVMWECDATSKKYDREGEKKHPNE